MSEQSGFGEQSGIDPQSQPGQQSYPGQQSDPGQHSYPGQQPHPGQQSRRLPRTGIGVDVHAFDAQGRMGLHLAGIHFPDEVALAGHSDGDVAAHAAADAVLVAAGAGDLGSVFGTDDERWAGASGSEILAEAAARVHLRGFTIGNVAVQVIGHRPKLAPHRERAQELLSAAAGAPVTLSATTTDALGLTGRGEGLAAIATALVLPPV